MEADLKRDNRHNIGLQAEFETGKPDMEADLKRDNGHSIQAEFEKDEYGDRPQ